MEVIWQYDICQQVKRVNFLYFSQRLPEDLQVFPAFQVIDSFERHTGNKDRGVWDVIPVEIRHIVIIDYFYSASTT
jgi:hypothetical protein